MGIEDFSQNLAESLLVLNESIITQKTKPTSIKTNSFIYENSTTIGKAWTSDDVTIMDPLKINHAIVNSPLSHL